MNSKTYFLFILSILLALLVATRAGADTPEVPEPSKPAHIMSYGIKPCTSSEKWFTRTKEAEALATSVGQTSPSGSSDLTLAARPLADAPTVLAVPPLDDTWILAFSKYLQGKTSVIESFSQALALRRLAATPHERVFSEYWVSRVLLASGMVHLAEIGFKSILQEDVTRQSAPFQLAALGCMNLTKRKNGVLSYKPEIISQLKEILEYAQQIAPELRSIIWETSVHLVAAGPEFHSGDSLKRLMQTLEGAGPYEALAKGIHSSELSLQAQGNGDHQKQAIQNLQAFFAAPSLPEGLVPLKDQAYLLLGRAWYSLGGYDKAIASYRKINMRSNEWVHALSELGWSYLMAGYYREAIGVGVGVQSGALKRTFSPETVMVMAMALNEMCYFPESLKMVNKFRKDYQKSYLWLKQEALHPTASYKHAIDYARNSPETTVPGAIASEWIRSSIFLTHQDQINLALRERTTSNLLTEQGVREQTQLAREIAKELHDLRGRYASAKIRLKAGESLPSDLVKKISHVKSELARFARIKNAAPTWRQMLAHFENRIQGVTHDSVSHISNYITQVNQRMLAQLEEISENHELLEVEIFNGASDDIIWQNAHPDYKAILNKMKTGKTEAAADKVWDWGNSVGGLDGRGEIWEDEVGSLSANLHDNCESKDKYLAIKNQFQNGI